MQRNGANGVTLERENVAAEQKARNPNNTIYQQEEKTTYSEPQEAAKYLNWQLKLNKQIFEEDKETPNKIGRSGMVCKNQRNLVVTGTKTVSSFLPSLKRPKPFFPSFRAFTRSLCFWLLSPHFLLRQLATEGGRGEREEESWRDRYQKCQATFRQPGNIY